MNLYEFLGNGAILRVDWLGLIDINLNPDGWNWNHTSKRTCFKEFAENAPDTEEDLTVLGHGSSSGIRDDRKDPSVNMGGDAGVKALADEIRNNADFKAGKIQRVVLYSCETGKGGKLSLAQKLADELQIPVMAPNELIACYSFGNWEICCRKEPAYYNAIEIDRERPGNWVLFRKGKEPSIMGAASEDKAEPVAPAPTDTRIKHE